MTRKRWLQIAAVALIVVVVAWGASRLLERVVSPVPEEPAAAAPVPPAANVPHIIATLYYGTSDGQALAAVKREVPLGEGPRAQGRQILQSELEAAPAPYLSLIPPGTMLRAFYITERGDAFVDLSPEVSTMHPGARRWSACRFSSAASRPIRSRDTSTCAARSSATHRW